MKWLLVLCSLVVGGQVYAEGLCKPLADGKGASNDCIADWEGAENAVAYAGALAAMLGKFSYAIVYDSYEHHGYWFGYKCIADIGNPNEDPPEQPRGCLTPSAPNTDINVSLTNAFHRTLDTANRLLTKLHGSVVSQLSYEDSSVVNIPELRDKIAACDTKNTHNKIAPLWNNFADNYKKDYKAYKDKYRKKIFKTYFTAIKRLYGIYASRMKKLMKKVGRDYDCDL